MLAFEDRYRYQKNTVDSQNKVVIVYRTLLEMLRS